MPTPDDLQRILGMLFLMFPQSADEATTKAKAAGYVMAVEEFSCRVLEEAVMDFIQAKVPEHNRKFVPTCAELAHHARKVRRKTEVPLGLLDFNDPEIQSDPDVIRQRQEAHEFAMKSL
jgi:hypothetical protein